MQQPYHYIGLDIHKRTVASCENLLDSPNENRDVEAAHKEHARTARGEYCLED